ASVAWLGLAQPAAAQAPAPSSPAARAEAPVSEANLRDQAVAARKAGKYDELLRIADTLLRERADDAQALAWRGFALWALGRSGDARSALARAVEIAPSNGDARLSLCRLLLLENQPAPAREHCERATQIAPGVPIAWLSLAHSYLLE